MVKGHLIGDANVKAVKLEHFILRLAGDGLSIVEGKGATGLWCIKSAVFITTVFPGKRPGSDTVLLLVIDFLQMDFFAEFGHSVVLHLQIVARVEKIGSLF